MLKLIVFFVSLSAFSQHVIFKGVNLPAYSEKGILESLIKCQTAVQLDHSVEMNTVEMEMFDEQKTNIKTEKCKYQKHEKLLSGSDEIFMKSLKMDLSGLGFEYDLTKKELSIQKNVVIYLNAPQGEKK